MNNDVRYPIGKFSMPQSLTPAERAAAIHSLAELPEKLHGALRGLSESQLDTPYRKDGWTIRQTVHHVADSHMQSYGRTRLALTEDWPAITPYQEDRFAELADARTQPVDVSVQLVRALHARWTALLESLSDSNWSARGYTHPETGRQSLEQVAAMYAWHGRHHTAQITAMRERMGW